MHQHDIRLRKVITPQTTFKMAGLRDNDEGSIDLESQVSERSDATGDSRNRAAQKSQAKVQKPVRMNFPAKVVEQFQRDYGIDPILATSETYHLHPHLAYQRNRLEEVALKYAVREATKPNPLIWDIGSGARRHAHYNIHCLCPYLQPGDAERLNACIRNGNSVCEHTLQTCTCSTPDILLFVHSAYYFTVAELTKSIMQSQLKTAYVVGHRFPEAFGSLAYGEAQYKLDLTSQALTIEMTAKGNSHVYRHPPLPWDVASLATTPMPVVDGIQLSVVVLANVGDTYLWRVTPRFDEPLIPWTYANWKEQIKDERHTGVIHMPGFDQVTKQCAAANGVMEVEVDCVYGRGHWLFMESKRGKVYMPRGLVEDVAFELTNKPRNPALWADASYLVKRALRRCALPPDEKLKALTLGTAMAFTYNVPNEVDAMQTITNRYDTLWKMHAQLTNLVPLKTISVWVLWLLAFACLVTFVLVVLMQPQLHGDGDTNLRAYAEWEGLPLLLLICVLVVTILCCCRFCVARYQSRRTADNWATTLFHEERPSNIVGQVSSQPSVTSFPVFNGLREALVPGMGTLTVGEDPRPRKHPGAPRIGLHLEGIATSLAVPTAPRTDAESEIVAITNRIMTAPTEVDKSAYDKFMDVGSRLSSQLLMAIRIVGSPTMYVDWINQTKFSLAVRDKFRKAYETKVLGNWVPSVGEYHAFVKFEKMKALTMELLIEGLKTRLINGPPDAVKVAVGPWTARLQSALVNAWDGYKCPILYASGRTPDYVGRACDDFARANGGWENMIGIWDDCVTYDSTLENELLAKRQQVYPAVGFPEITMKWLNSTAPRGRTTHGVTYELGKKKVTIWDGQEVNAIKLFSGDMDTNLIGSIVNGEAHESGLPRDYPHLMLVTGDDNFILARRDLTNIHVTEGLRAHLEALGLKPVQGVSVDRHDWEFCSKLFWWGRDRQTGQVQTVLGPKPGRWLHRIGWTVNAPKGMNFRAAMLSSAQDVNHIPLVSDYVRKGLAVTGHMKARGNEYSEMKHVSKMYDPVPENFRILEGRYGLNEPHIAEFEATLQQVTVRQVIIDLPWIAAAAKRDEE